MLFRSLAILAAVGLTQLVFPIGWSRLLSGSGLVTGVLGARNVLLVAAAALSCWRITSATSLRHEEPCQAADGATAAVSAQAGRNHLLALLTRRPDGADDQAT